MTHQPRRNNFDDSVPRLDIVSATRRLWRRFKAKQWGWLQRQQRRTHPRPLYRAKLPNHGGRDLAVESNRHFSKPSQRRRVGNADSTALPSLTYRASAPRHCGQIQVAPQQVQILPAVISKLARRRRGERRDNSFSEQYTLANAVARKSGSWQALCQPVAHRPAALLSPFSTPSATCRSRGRFSLDPSGRQRTE